MNSNEGLVLRSFRIRPSSPEPRVVNTPASAPPETPRKRLSGPDRDLDRRLLPFRRHWPDRSWHDDWRLYWVPASFENRSSTKCDPRFLYVFEGLLEFLNGKVAARGLTFMDSQLTYPHLIEHMVLNAIEYLPLSAMGFHPGRGAASLPRYDEIVAVDFRSVYERLKEKQQAFRTEDMFPNAPKPQHFILGDQDLARRNLMGRGGFTFYLSRHGQAEFGELAQQILQENTTDPVMREIPMPVPLLDSAAFTTARAEHLEACFNLFDLYVAESPADTGILIAATHDLDEVLPELIRQAGYRQPKRGVFGRSA